MKTTWHRQAHDNWQISGRATRHLNFCYFQYYPFGSIGKKISEKTWHPKWHFFHSQGYCKYSVLFYGYYNDQRTVGVLKFRLPLSYLMVGIGTFGYSLMLVIRTWVYSTCVDACQFSHIHHKPGGRRFIAELRNRMYAGIYFDTFICFLSKSAEQFAKKYVFNYKLHHHH